MPVKLSQKESQSIPAEKRSSSLCTMIHLAAFHRKTRDSTATRPGFIGNIALRNGRHLIELIGELSGSATGSSIYPLSTDSSSWLSCVWYYFLLMLWV